MSVLAPVTFLDLVQRLAFEAGITATSIPTTVLSQIGQAADLVNWVSSACNEINLKHDDWSFNIQSPGVSFTTVNGQAIYTQSGMGVVATGVSMWKRHTFRNFQTSIGQKSEIFMEFLPYDNWRDLYQFGALRFSPVRPMAFTITPGKNIGLQTPLDGYTITGDYYAYAPKLLLDADTPTLPPDYIMIIVYRALMAYGLFENAPEVFNRGEAEYEKILKNMEANRLPEIGGVGGLA